LRTSSEVADWGLDGHSDTGHAPSTGTNREPGMRTCSFGDIARMPLEASDFLSFPALSAWPDFSDCSIFPGQTFPSNTPIGSRVRPGCPPQMWHMDARNHVPPWQRQTIVLSWKPEEKPRHDDPITRASGALCARPG